MSATRRHSAQLADETKVAKDPWSLLRQAPSALSDIELVALLLAGSADQPPPLQEASRLLEDSNGLEGLRVVEALGWHSPGVLSSEGADRFRACLEVCRRLLRDQIPRREPLSHPAAVARYLAWVFSVPGQEIMGALYLDARNRLLAEREIYRGTLSRAAVEPRAVLKDALFRDAASVVLFHTHPSGDPTPSVEDLAFTRRLAQAGELIGIRLVDHLILGAQGCWTSLRERGGW